MSATGLLKPLRFARFWLALWWMAIAATIAACLVRLPPMALPDNSDKVEHFLAYFVLAGSAVQIYRTRAALAWAGVGLVGLGIGIEVAQGALTATRMADPMDVLANSIGVVAGLSLMFTPLRDLLLRLRG
ncbi:VanZ family protein [Stenotrophomonas rhizophila]|uniref:VanZ family protein n=1 Tax=Stenotrophomonas rhizophila TaxID=216778 RepID=UPI0028D54C31|nr:VanZ family protein [Stenotrophomonas rhizophila]